MDGARGTIISAFLIATTAIVLATRPAAARWQPAAARMGGRALATASTPRLPKPAVAVRAIAFEPNRGQAFSEVAFLARTSTAEVTITPAGVRFVRAGARSFAISLVD